jgi:hypothetical protein
LLNAPSPGSETATRSYTLMIRSPEPVSQRSNDSSCCEAQGSPVNELPWRSKLAAGLDANNNRGVKILKGEVGVLIYVHAGGASNTCYLVIEHENQNYNGSLVFDDARSCRQIIDLLQQHLGRSIKEIGDLDVSFTPNNA